MKTFCLVLLSNILLTLLLLGCSSVKYVNTPYLPGDEKAGAYEICGSGMIYLDRDSKQVSIANDRENEHYFNVTSYVRPYLEIRILSIVGDIWEIEVELTNPTAIQVWDVRAVFLNLYGKKILNPDGYTNLFKPSGVNPFLAFAKEYPDRAFPVGPGAKDTEILLLEYPSGAGPFVCYMIGVSVGSNCGDPYMIASQEQVGELYPSGGSATISADVYDHQGDITAVAVATTALTGGLTYLTAIDGTKYAADITNSENAPVGEYTCIIAADSPNPNNLCAYNYMVLTVIEEPVLPPVVTYDEAVTVGAVGKYTDNGIILVLPIFIDFTTGPWDFSNTYYDTIVRNEVISPNASEFSIFKSKYPAATHVLKMPNFYETSCKYYPHYYMSSKRYDLGFEDSEQGPDKGFKYNNPVEVPYPIDVNYSYDAVATGTTKIILPTPFTITWDVDCIAWGEVKTHTITEKALLIRTIRSLVIGTWPEQNEAIYEWVGDSGHILASIKTTDFDETTGLPNPDALLEGYLFVSASP